MLITFTNTRARIPHLIILQEPQSSYSLHTQRHSLWFYFCCELHTLSLDQYLYSHDSCWIKNLVLFILDIKSNNSTFIIFTFGNHVRAYGSIIALHIPPHLLTLTVNGLKRVSLKFILITIGLVWYGWIFRDTNFINNLELKTNDSPKLPIIQALNNLINFF